MRILLAFLRMRLVKSAVVKAAVPILDVLLAPLTLAAALLMKSLRRVGIYRLPASKAIFNAVGVFPIRDHYYEPLFNPKHLRGPLDVERSLPGIDFNLQEQLKLLSQFEFENELERIPRSAPAAGFYYENPNFPAGDAEFLYCAIRHFKPARILEIGSGFSTLMMLEAMEANRQQKAGYACELVCVEPYEMEWLEKRSEVRILRQHIETLDERYVRELGANDILFIDSSHVIRPQGDVVHEYLSLLPLLAPGVLVHVHDIFTPRDYPAGWVIDEVRLWNEQYLFEAFMSCNSRFRIVGALNMLARDHARVLGEKFPVFREQAGNCDPGSVWLVSC